MAQATSLAGKGIVITGAGRGIGAACAEAAARLGAFVVVNDMDEAAAQETVSRIEAQQGCAVAHCGDVSDFDYCGRLIESCVAEHGRIDALVNNAGLFRMGTVWEMQEKDLRALVAVNVFGTAFCAMHAVSKMKAAGLGSIINVTSGASGGIPAMGAYGATKGAVSSFTYAWALELAGSGVRVNAISPTASTRMVDHMYEYKRGPEGQTRPFNNPAHPAAVVCFLASDAAQDVNGQVLRVAGGELRLISHPKPMSPSVPLAEWSADTVAAAFREHLAAHQVQTGIYN